MFVTTTPAAATTPWGSPAVLSGRLERAVEKRGGRFLYETEVTGILFDAAGHVRGVRTGSGDEISAPQVVYAGAVHPLYRRLLPPEAVPARDRARIERHGADPSQRVLYGHVKADAVPAGPSP